jgi:hypothetical protein
MKKIKVLNWQDAEGTINGSSFKGYIIATYSQLLEVLGEPTYSEQSEDGKVQVEWVVEFEDNIFTVYDWKTYSREYTENELMKFNIGSKVTATDFITELEAILK